jgi:aspartate kinase
MFRALAESNVNIQMITTSEIKISVLVSRDQGAPALRTVHRVFELDKEPAGARTPSGAKQPPHSGDAGAIVARLQGMEDLEISDIALDDGQARVTIANVPDAPGLAAQVFEQIAAGGILVDMIVQSFGGDGLANLSFTVPQPALDEAVKLSEGLAANLNCGPVTSCPRVAKLSVSGIGMRSHTGVAIRMFRALADAGINLDMINTSEVRVNVVVDGSAGPEALKRLQAAFADAQR